MKNKLLLSLLLFCTAASFAQVTTKMQTDSLRVFQVGGYPAELILENSTRGNVNGFLQNWGNGRTRFSYALDSAWKTGNILSFRRGLSNLSFTFRDGIDSIHVSNDSLYEYKDGIPVYKGTITGSGGANNYPSTLSYTNDVLTLGRNGLSNLTTSLPFSAKQDVLSGTGIVKSTSGTISYIIDNSPNWNTAYSWGNHASFGYQLQSNLSTSTSLGTSDVQYPSQNAVKTYVDNGLNSKLPASDTANKWISVSYKRNDSVFYQKGSTEYFSFIDSTGTETDLISRAVNSTLPISPVAWHPHGFNEMDIIPSNNSSSDYELFYDDRVGTRYITYTNPSDLQGLVGTSSDVSIQSGYHYPTVFKTASGYYYMWAYSNVNNQTYLFEGSNISALQSATAQTTGVSDYDFSVRQNKTGGFIASGVNGGQAEIFTAPTPRGPWTNHGKIFAPLAPDSFQLLNPEYAVNQADPQVFWLNSKLYCLFNGITNSHLGVPIQSHDCVVELDPNTYKAIGRPVEVIHALDRSFQRLTRADTYSIGNPVWMPGNPVFIQNQGRDEIWYIASNGNAGRQDSGYIARIVLSTDKTNYGYGGVNAIAKVFSGRSDFANNVLHTFYGTVNNRDSGMVVTSGTSGMWNYFSLPNVQNFKLQTDFRPSALPAVGDSSTIFRMVADQYPGDPTQMKLTLNHSGILVLRYTDGGGNSTNYTVTGTVSVGQKVSFNLFWEYRTNTFLINGTQSFSRGDYYGSTGIYSLFNDSTDILPPAHQFIGTIYDFSVELIPNSNNTITQWTDVPNGVEYPAEVSIGTKYDNGSYPLQVNGNGLFLTSNNAVQSVDVGTTSGGYDNGGKVRFKGAGDGIHATNTLATVEGTFISDNVGQLKLTTLSGQPVYIRGGKLQLAQFSSDPSIGYNGEMYYNSSLNKFRVYQNGGWVDMIGGGGNTPKTLNVQYTDASNTGTTETDLLTYTLPANQLLNNGDRIVIEAMFTTPSNGDSKDLKFYFGTYSHDWSPSTIASGATIKVKVTIIKTGASTQRIMHEMYTGFTEIPGYTTEAQTDTGTINIKFTGTCAASTDITQRTMSVTYYPAP